MSRKRLKTLISHLSFPFDLIHNRDIKNNVVMIHLGRSGSTVLGDLLNQHSKVKWGGEIYAKHIKRNSNNFFEMLEFKHNMYDTLKKERRGVFKKIYGYEIKFYHLHFLGESLQKYLEKIRAMGVNKIIILERSNHLKLIVSSLVALENGVWHSKHEKPDSLTKIKMDVNDLWTDGESKTLIEFLNSYQESFKNTRAILKGTNTLNLNYEKDILNNPTEAYNEACKYLEVPPENPKTNYWRTTPHSLEDIIINFQEVKEYLKDTAFEWMLYDKNNMFFN